MFFKEEISKEKLNLLLLIRLLIEEEEQISRGSLDGFAKLEDVQH